jgi:hypothetical protein
MKTIKESDWCLILTCLNPACGKQIAFELEPPVVGESIQWADIPAKLDIRCPSCGISGEYHPRQVRGGRALPTQ